MLCYDCVSETIHADEECMNLIFCHDFHSHNQRQYSHELCTQLACEAYKGAFIGLARPLYHACALASHAQCLLSAKQATVLSLQRLLL